MNLPQIPDCKKWNGNSTPEQDILMKIQLGKQISKDDIDILDCAYEFYGKAFTAMKVVNLSEINHEQANTLKQYLKDVVNMELIFQNPVTTGLVFRMTWIAGYNEEDGKVSIDLVLTPQLTEVLTPLMLEADPPVLFS